MARGAAPPGESSLREGLRLPGRSPTGHSLPAFKTNILKKTTTPVPLRPISISPHCPPSLCALGRGPPEPGQPTCCGWGDALHYSRPSTVVPHGLPRAQRGRPTAPRSLRWHSAEPGPEPASDSEARARDLNPLPAYGPGTIPGVHHADRSEANGQNSQTLTHPSKPSSPITASARICSVWGPLSIPCSPRELHVPGWAVTWPHPCPRPYYSPGPLETRACLSTSAPATGSRDAPRGFHPGTFDLPFPPSPLPGSLPHQRCA